MTDIRYEVGTTSCVTPRGGLVTKLYLKTNKVVFVLVMGTVGEGGWISSSVILNFGTS